MQYDIDFIRAQFPALSGNWIYFDNAGGSQILKQVTDRISNYLLNTNVQLGATYEISHWAGERVDQARKSMAQLINARHDSEIIMGSSTSLLIKILSLCLAETFNKNDEIIVTNCDHEANIGAWMSLEKRGLIIKTWKLNPETFKLELEDLQKLMNEKTRLVAFTHTSNILGTLNPLKEITHFIHQKGAKVCIDAVAYAPHRLVDVTEWDVDFYLFSFYKTYGPHYAMLYGKKSHLLNMPGINHYFIGQDESPLKFQPGNVNYELGYSMLGLCDYLREFASRHADVDKNNLKECAAVSFARFALHEEKLSARLRDFLNSKAGVKIIGEKTPDKNVRVPTISFVVKDTLSSSITGKVDQYKIGIRYGNFYAARLIDYLGLARQDGVVRVSMLHYNTLEEVDKLITVFDTLC